MEDVLNELQEIPDRRQRPQHALEDLVLEVRDDGAVTAEREEREAPFDLVERRDTGSVERSVERISGGTDAPA